MAFVMNPLKSLSKDRGAIIHSDQGFHYQTPMFINTLKKFDSTQSMSRKSTPVDNAPIESFCHILKANIVYDKHYQMFHKFKAVLDDTLSTTTTIIASSKNSMVCRRFNIGNSPLSLLVNLILSNYWGSFQCVETLDFW